MEIDFEKTSVTFLTEFTPLYSHDHFLLIIFCAFVTEVSGRTCSMRSTER